jgi:NADPH:quinone reductase-like Zn-dependent oxidoreductase
MAGQVGAVGKDVTEFRPGDEVFGSRSGTFAEYVSMPEDGVVLAKPANRGWHPGSSSRAIPR